MEHDLTRGNVLKTIAVFALPYMLSYFLQMLYGMADLYMMGQFSGAAGITAVGNGAQTLYIITVTLVGLAMGTTVIVGHAVGSRRFDRAETAIGNTITLFMGVSVVLAAILLALCPQIVALIGTPAEAVEGTAAYLRICFMGIPFIAAYNILSAIFRGLGDSRSPMYVIGVACIINIALDFLFIGHMGLGPVGAALGTVTAQTASVALALVWLKSRRTNIHVKRSDLRPQPEVLGSILKIGVPVAVQDGCIQVAFMFITVIANHRGLVDAAAVGLVEKMISFLFIVPSSMGATVSALTAQNAGAGKGDRARQVLKICAATFSTRSLPASTFALAAFSLRMARATSALRTTCWLWYSFAYPVHGCCRTPIPTRCFPWASPRRADRFCRRSFALSRLPCSTAAELLTSWWRSGATRAWRSSPVFTERSGPVTDMPSEHTEGLLRIGEVARLLNLSVGTLRHYEQMGLLEPAYVDPASGYRYYGSRQLSTLNTIGNLRVLDLPLTQIREFVTTRDMDLMQRQLTKQQELIEHRRRELERMSRKIDQRLALLHGALNADLDTISEIEEPELRCATLHERVNPTDAYSLGWHIRQLQQGQHETFAYLGNLGVGIAPERLAAGDFDGYDEVFLLLDDTDDYLGDVETRPAARCLTISFRGTHGQAGSRYEQILGYMHEHGLAPAGPSREIALIDDIISDDPATYVTQITVPVAPAK